MIRHSGEIPSRYKEKGETRGREIALFLANTLALGVATKILLTSHRKSVKSGKKPRNMGEIAAAEAE